MTLDAQTAEQIMWSALRQYGMPRWCAHMSITERQAIPQARRAEILQMALYDPTIEKADDIIEHLVIRWCDDHLFAHISHHHLAIEIGITPERAYRLINANPTRFRKVQRGLWEVRDPKADRRI